MLFELGKDERVPGGAGCERTSARSAAMSLGLRTKLRAIASTPCAIPQAASARSLAVSVGTDRVAPGRLRPLKLRRMPPRTTSQVMRGSSVARTRTSIRPSSIRIVPPGRTSRASGAYCTGSASPPPDSRLRGNDGAGEVAAGSTVRSSVSPGAMGRPAPGTGPRRILGPCKSWRMASGRSDSPAIRRSRSITRAWVACVPCEKFSRATSMPAPSIARSVASSSQAGPMVATIQVRRGWSVAVDMRV